MSAAPGLAESHYLKSSFYEQLVEHMRLAEKPGGCVVWLVRHREEGACRLDLTYRFFGGAPGERLPSLEGFRIAKHTKANAQGVKGERPNLRVVPKGSFQVVETTCDLLERLFGLGDSGRLVPPNMSGHT